MIGSRENELKPLRTFSVFLSKENPNTALIRAAP